MSKMGCALVVGIAICLVGIGFLIGSINGPYWLQRLIKYGTILTNTITILSTIFAALIAASVVYWNSRQDLQNQKKAVLNTLRSELISNQKYVQSFLRRLDVYHDMIKDSYSGKTQEPLLMIFNEEYSHLKEKIGLVDPKVLPTILLVYNNLRVHERRILTEKGDIFEDWNSNDNSIATQRTDFEKKQLERICSFCSLGVMKLNELLGIKTTDKLKKDAELAQKEIEQSETEV